MKNKIKFYPNKNTKFFVSVSSNPGTSGSNLHNKCFEIFKINAFYMPIKCNNERELKNIINFKKNSGISVSMPFKKKVIKYLDKIDEIARKTDSVNTILRKRGKLIGYNTDYYGAKKNNK